MESASRSAETDKTRIGDSDLVSKVVEALGGTLESTLLGVEDGAVFKVGVTLGLRKKRDGKNQM